MMKNLKILGLIVLLLGTIQACSTYSYYSIGGENLGRYRSFAWLPPVKQTRNIAYNSDLADQRIHESTTDNLQERGLRLKSKNPDLLVRYSVMVDNKERVYDQPVYNYAGGGYYPSVGYFRGRQFLYYRYSAPYPVYVGDDVERVPYKEGTLIIDLIDRNSHKVIWRGYGVGELENAAKTIDDLPKIVEGIMKKLPLKPTKS